MTLIQKKSFKSRDSTQLLPCSIVTSITGDMIPFHWLLCFPDNENFPCLMKKLYNTILRYLTAPRQHKLAPVTYITSVKSPYVFPHQQAIPPLQYARPTSHHLKS